MSMPIAYDDVVIGLIPRNAQVVGVYVDGRFANEAAARRAFPHAELVTITVTGRPGARFCDCEPGDLTASSAAHWAHAELDAGRTPGIYSSVSEMRSVLASLAVLGIARAQVILWTAHYTGSAHLCGPDSCKFPGFGWHADATQFTDRAEGRSLDASEITPAFLGPARDRYGRFVAGRFPSHWGELNERAVVQAYDQARPHPMRNHAQLDKLRAQLDFLGGRLLHELLEQTDRIGDPFSRAWRYRQIHDRAEGKEVVRP
jgi:hypothetical protein